MVVSDTIYFFFLFLHLCAWKNTEELEEKGEILNRSMNQYLPDTNIFFLNKK